MRVDIQTIKRSVRNQGYRWYNSRPNIIGIRSSLDIPDVFNDSLFLIWKQQKIPTKLSPKNLQKWLRRSLFLGKNKKPLLIDGKIGPQTRYALGLYYKAVGKWRMRSYAITTDPGTFWLRSPLNVKGTAILKPGQYVDAYSLGYHRRSKKHPALIQTGPVTVYRDNDMDAVLDEVGSDTGYFGINIHRSNMSGTTTSIGKWSAGCQVFANRVDHLNMLGLLYTYKSQLKNKYTYTLLDQEDLI